MSDSGPLECRHREWLCTREQCLENVHVKTSIRKAEETNNKGRELADMPGHIFLGPRKGVTSHSLLSLPRLCPTTRVVGRKTLVVPVLPQHEVWHSKTKVVHLWGACYQIPVSPARELEEQTESTSLPRGRAGHCLVVGRDPSLTLQE